MIGNSGSCRSPSVFEQRVDLGEAGLVDKYRAIYERAGYEVHFVSTYEDTGLEEMRKFLRGKTSVLAGPSGVGKSSLTNCIQPQAAMETGDISRKIERGRHTTRHSELIYVEEETYMHGIHRDSAPCSLTFWNPEN